MAVKFLLLPGDGIGPEIMAQMRRILEWFEARGVLSTTIEEEKVGGSGYDNYEHPCADKVMELAKQADVVMLGAVGGDKWADLPFDKRPEAGLLRLRKDLDLFANLRPAICFDALAHASSLKSDIITGLDILIVRELVSGVYFGMPRGIFPLPDNSGDKGVDTQSYTSAEVQRVGQVAFELAAKRQGRVTSCDKANVMHSGILWRREMTALHQKHFSHLTLEHMYADNAAMQLVRCPKQFDVIVTDNLFGDLLSDIAAMLTGSLGMLPSASLGTRQVNSGRQHAMYEPVHGSAPDIAGQNIANPCAMILSLAMALRFSLDRGDLADHLEKAVSNTLSNGIRTADIMADNCQQVTTTQMGDAIIEQLNAGSA